MQAERNEEGSGCTQVQTSDVPSKLLLPRPSAASNGRGTKRTGAESGDGADIAKDNGLVQGSKGAGETEPVKKRAKASATINSGAIGSNKLTGRWDGISTTFRGYSVHTEMAYVRGVHKTRGYVYMKHDKCGSSSAKFALGLQGTSAPVLRCCVCNSKSSKKSNQKA